VAARRRAPAPEESREAASFSLPGEPKPERPASETRRSEPKEARAAGEPEPRRDEKAVAEKPAKAGADKADTDKPKSAEQPKAEAKPAAAPAAQTTAPVAPATATEQPKLDAGALVAIAAAAQGEAGKAQAAAEIKGDASKETIDSEPVVPGEAKAVDPSAILPAPPLVAEAVPANGAALAATTAVAEGQSEAAALAGIAIVAAGDASVRPADAAPGPAVPNEQAVQATAPPPKAHVPPATLALEAAGKAEPGTDTDTPVAGGEVDAAPSAKDIVLDRLGPAAAPGAFADAVKAAEAAPQTQIPIDLSTVVPPRTGKIEGLSGLDALAQATTQQAPGAPGQGKADGPATPLHVVPIEIGLRALAGSKSFDIRLDPAELGRIDVNLDISDSGEVSARLVVDRVETLHLLQRDARTLERAFEQAGLKPSDAGVDITLRDPSDQSGFRQSRQEQEASRQSQRTADAAEDDLAIPAQPAPVRRLVRLGGVDLSI
jgi:flagellar hook-length control protein FliK